VRRDQDRLRHICCGQPLVTTGCGYLPTGCQLDICQPDICLPAPSPAGAGSLRGKSAAPAALSTVNNPTVLNTAMNPAVLSTARNAVVTSLMIGIWTARPWWRRHPQLWAHQLWLPRRSMDPTEATMARHFRPMRPSCRRVRLRPCHITGAVAAMPATVDNSATELGLQAHASGTVEAVPLPRTDNHRLE
jgi:hypothetical protein